jgi:hypothetical protein
MGAECCGVNEDEIIFAYSKFYVEGTLLTLQRRGCIEESEKDDDACCSKSPGNGCKGIKTETNVLL